MFFKNVLKLFLITSIFLFVAGSVSALTIDSFDFYNDGNLAGQGGWSGGATPQIQGTTTQGGSTKAVQIATYSQVQKTLGIADGNLIGYIRAEGKGAGIWPLTLGVKDSMVIAEVYFSESGNIEIAGQTEISIFTNFATSTWYKIEIQWQTSDSKIRGRVNDGSWSSWDNPQGAWTKANYIYFNGGVGATGYVDTLTSTGRLLFLDLPSDIATSTLAYAGQLFTDLSLVIILTIGLPIGFWVIKKVISLV